MSRAAVRCLAVLLPVAVLAGGCGIERAPADAGLPLAGDGRLHWQGVSRCADCDAIETRLQLVRDGGDASYRLDERFVDGDGAHDFAEDGRWRLRGGVLELEGRLGARRSYALVPGGALRAVDAGGRPLSAGDDDLLQPVAAEPF